MFIGRDNTIKTYNNYISYKTINTKYIPSWTEVDIKTNELFSFPKNDASIITDNVIGIIPKLIIWIG